MNQKQNNNTAFDYPPYPANQLGATAEREPEIANILNNLDREILMLDENSHIFIDRIKSVMGVMTEKPSNGDTGFPVSTPLGQRLMSIVNQVEVIRRRLYDAKNAVEL